MTETINLADRRPPTIYYLTVTHDWHGDIAVEVHDIPDDGRSRKSVAAAVRAFADMLDGSPPSPR